ncbi:MAG TPA: FG-GAP-like repeat-containing protein [Bryobacteraceae bacterium]|nr:FG-GAP-like repeat-containing protein [Bryobacteraceae bacterium]
MNNRIVAVLCFVSSAAAAVPPRFRAHVLATDLTGGYQVTAADVNGDGRTDIIAVATGMSDLVWFENPTWKRRVLASGIERPINLAARDVDGDRIPEIVVAAGWSNVAAKSRGTVWLLKSAGDPLHKWRATEIDRLPTSHRIRVLMLDGQPVFVNAPLIGADSLAPDYRSAVPLVFYAPGDWKRRVIGSDNHGVVHGLSTFDWDGDGREDVVTASFEGVHWFRNAPQRAWARSIIVPGDPAAWPKNGASEIAIGRAYGKRFLVTVEPWHGSQICVYTERGGAWYRRIQDASYSEVHAVRTADLDADGNDDIVAAVRSKPGAVLAYFSKPDNWDRVVLDEGGVTASDCAVADLNRDGLPDIACIGAATANLKFYENLGAALAASHPLAVVEKKAGHVGFYDREGTRVAGAAVGQYPHEIVRSPDGKLLYVSDNGILWMTEAGEGGNTISIVDVASKQRTGIISLGDHRRPHGMDVDRKRNRLVVTTENPPGLLLIDLSTRSIIRTYDTQGTGPHMVLLSADAAWAYVSNTNTNSIAAIHLDSGRTKLIATDARPQGGVRSLDGRLLYITNNAGNTVTVVDTRRQERVGAIATGNHPARIALTPDGRTLVYNLQDDDAIAFADVRMRRQVAVVPIGGPPLSLTLSSDGRWAYAGIQDRDKIAVVSVADRKLIGAIPTPKDSGPDPALPLP